MHHHLVKPRLQVFALSSHSFIFLLCLLQWAIVNALGLVLQHPLGKTLLRLQSITKQSKILLPLIFTGRYVTVLKCKWQIFISWKRINEHYQYGVKNDYHWVMIAYNYSFIYRYLNVKVLEKTKKDTKYMT